MLRHLPVRQSLYAAIVLPLLVGSVFGDGVIINAVEPNCPNCGAPGSPPCPANVKYYGYYPTLWRRWPGTEPMPAAASSTTMPQPNNVEVPAAEREAVGRPGGTNDSGASGASVAPVPEANVPGGTAPGPALPGAMTPGGATPSTTAPGASAPMLNGLPVPNGAQLPNGVPVPIVPLPSGVTTPSNGALPNGTLPSGGVAPNILPAPSSPNPAGNGSQMLPSFDSPLAMPMRPIPGESVSLNQAWIGGARQPVIQPNAIQPTATMSQAAQAPAMQAPPMQPREIPAAAIEIGRPITPVGALEPSTQWPPVNDLRSTAIRAGFQSPEKTSYNSPPLDAIPATPIKPREFSRSDDSVSLRIVSEKPASPAAIPTDDWSPDHQSTVSISTSAEPAVVAARFVLPTDQIQNHFVQPARLHDRSQTNQLKPMSWSAANSPAALAPIYQCPPDRGAYGTPASSVDGTPRCNANGNAFNASNNAGLNAPGIISPAQRPIAVQAIPPGGRLYSPLRDAVVNLHPIADGRSSTSLSAIDPLQIGGAMATGQQPAMQPLPIQNGLSRDRFEATDYAAQDRSGRPTTYAATQPPTADVLTSAAPGNANPQRTTDTAVQQVSYVQTGPTDSAKLQSIDPLEIARSMSPTPAAPPTRATGF